MSRTTVSILVVTLVAAAQVAVANPFQEPLDQARAELRRLNDVYSVAKRDLDDARAELVQLDRKYKIANRDLVNARTELGRVDGIYKSVTRDFQNAQAELARLHGIYIATRRDLANARTELDSLSSIYQSVKRDLDNALAELNRLNDIYKAARRDLAKAQEGLGPLDKTYSSVRHQLDSARKELQHAEKEFQERSSALKYFIAKSTEMGHLLAELQFLRDRAIGEAEQTKVEIDRLLNSEVVAFEFRSRLLFKINLRQATAVSSGTIVGDMRMDSSAIESLLKESFTIPVYIDPSEVLKLSRGIQVTVEDGYDALRPETSTLYSSRNWIDYWPLEAIPNEAINAIISSGTVVKQPVGETRRFVLTELQDVYEYLRFHGRKDFERVLPEILKALVEGESRKLNTMGLSYRTHSLPYKYSLSVQPIPAPLRKLLGLAQDPLGQYEIPHSAFALKIRRRGRKSDSDALIHDALTRFDSWSSGKSLDFEKILSRAAVDSPAVRKLFFGEDVANPASMGKIVDRDTGERIRKLTIQKLGLTPETLLKASRSGLHIDLSQTPAGQSFSALLEPLVIGNQGEVQLDELKLNVATGCLSAFVTLKHRHSWGSVTEAAGEAENALRSAGYEQPFSAGDFFPEERSKRLNSLGVAHEKAKREAKQITSQLARAAERMGELRDQVNRARAAKLKSQESLTAVQKEVQHSEKRMQMALAEYNQQLDNAVGPFQVRRKKAGEDYDRQLSDSVRPLQERLKKAAEDYDRQLNSSVRPLQDRLSKTAGDYNRHLNNSVKPMQEWLKESAEDYDRQLNASGKPLQERLMKAAEEYNRHLNNSVRPLQDRLNNAAEAYDRQRSKVNDLVRKYNDWISQPRQPDITLPTPQIQDKR